jgi:hypothetical protein
LSERCGLRGEQMGVWLRYRQYLGKDGTPEFHQPMAQQMTSWGLLYRAMRAAFPKEAYFENDALVGFHSDAAKVHTRSSNQSWIWRCRACGKAASRWSVTRPSFRDRTRRQARRKQSLTQGRWAQP